MTLQVAAIVLAAGMSRRMGAAKPFLELNGKPLFRYAVERAVASGLHPVVLITGEHSARMRQLTGDLPQVEVVDNPEYRTGMAASLRVGVAAVRGRADAALVFLADQPLVPDAVVQGLVDAYRSRHAEGVRIVRPLYAGSAGHPVLFASSLFDELSQVSGDQGGKEVVSRYKQQMAAVSFEQAEWGLDVDTPEEYQALLRKQSQLFD
ncbi:4-diphosphocytidyl-2C-methyl-D-erythritol kinase [Brevibacillus panacihumi W25]|uniref:4-diphosphocytidyl-2C-methyl-D-erythritol kinase n=1 Tax=Brevibacillus panacihumi W25 TaxID=1408254 RepID=V6M9G2_9BACL|nr:nucleotidyltransferase family protein [Brevibacillus panacihumi]EST54515.1 4-diphosphocytidyl-2C-methyl-D-erythritol kinase [Brevibacillus panacihumi W25]